MTPQEAIDRIVAESEGARVFCADLHVHSAHSRETGKPLPSVPQILDRARELGLDMLAITDHNTVEGFLEADRFIKEKDLQLGLVPGFELSTGFTDLHLLAYFPPEDSPEHTYYRMRDCLVTLGIESSIQKSDPAGAHTSKSPTAAAQTLRSHNAIVVIAHSERGVVTPGAEKDALFASRCVLGLETGDDHSVLLDPYTSNRCLLRSSDAHSLEMVGSRRTYIVGEKPDFFTLYAAVTDPECRTSFDAPKVRYPFIRGLVVEAPLGATSGGGMLDGFAIRFNQGLNCLIGERGTFKSSLIQFMRAVFETAPPTESDAEYVRQEIKTRDKFLAEVLGESRRIHVVVAVGDNDHKVASLEHTARHNTVELKDAVGAMQERTVREACPLSLYVHDGIKARAEDDSWLTALVDELIDGVAEKSSAEMAILRQLAENRAKLAALTPVEESVKQEQKAVEGWNEARARLGVSDAIGEIVDAKEATLAWLAGVRRKIKSLAIPLDQLPESLTFGPEPVIKKSAAQVPDLLRDVRATLAEAQAHVAVAKDVRAKLAALFIKLTEIERGISSAFDAELLGSVAEPTTGASVEANTKRYREVSALITAAVDRINKSSERLKDKSVLRKERETLLDSLDRVRDERFALRDRRSKELWQTGTTTIGWEKRGNDAAYFDFVKTVLTKKGLLDEYHKRPLVKALSPRQLAARIRAVDMDGISKATSLDIGIVQRFFTQCPQFTKCDLELEEVHYDDLPRIYFSDMGTTKPLASLSAGQRAAVLLKLILSGGRGPLIIDQPEDDIDNKVIYSDVVKDIRRQKRCRQIVVATHQANIPVIGDAEKILVLHSDGAHGTLGAQGCIENRDVTKYVLDILEGGKDALKLRYKKYQDEDLLR